MVRAGTSGAFQATLSTRSNSTSVDMGENSQLEGKCRFSTTLLRRETGAMLGSWTQTSSSRKVAASPRLFQARTPRLAMPRKTNKRRLESDQGPPSPLWCGYRCLAESRKRVSGSSSWPRAKNQNRWSPPVPTAELSVLRRQSERLCRHRPSPGGQWRDYARFARTTERTERTRRPLSHPLPGATMLHSARIEPSKRATASAMRSPGSQSHLARLHGPALRTRAPPSRRVRPRHREGEQSHSYRARRASGQGNGDGGTKRAQHLRQLEEQGVEFWSLPWANLERCSGRKLR